MKALASVDSRIYYRLLRPSILPSTSTGLLDLSGAISFLVSASARLSTATAPTVPALILAISFATVPVGALSPPLSEALRGRWS